MTHKHIVCMNVISSALVIMFVLRVESHGMVHWLQEPAVTISQRNNITCPVCTRRFLINSNRSRNKCCLNRVPGR